MRLLVVVSVGIFAHLGCATAASKEAAGEGLRRGSERISIGKRGEETVKSFDLNADGRPDVWEYSAPVADSSGKSGERLVRKELDLNWDGRIDIQKVYNAANQLEREAFDLDFDGVVDQLNHYEKGQLVRKERNLAQNGQAELFLYYEKGKLARKERDSNGDGRIDTWEYWDNGQVDRIGEDLDGDGSVDHWTRSQSTPE